MVNFVGIDVFSKQEDAEVVAQQYRIDTPPRKKVKVVTATGGIGLYECVNITQCNLKYDTRKLVYIVYSEVSV